MKPRKKSKRLEEDKRQLIIGKSTVTGFIALELTEIWRIRLERRLWQAVKIMQAIWGSLRVSE